MFIPILNSPVLHVISFGASAEKIPSQKQEKQMKNDDEAKYLTGDLTSVDVRVVEILEGLLCLFLGSETNEGKLPTLAIPAQNQDALSFVHNLFKAASYAFSESRSILY